MSSPALEAFLARLYTDDAFLRDFLDDPDRAAQTAGLSPDAIAALGAIDRDSLVMAARSFRAKRAQSPPLAAPGLFRRWRRHPRPVGKLAPK